MYLNKMLDNCTSLVSIIVPCYNYAHFLPQSLNSVLNQSYQDWECIIVDDGSTDNTREVVQQYIIKDIRFTYIYQTNAGQSATRNNGLRHAKGDFIQFLDADDLLENDKLEQQLTFLKQHPDIDIVYGEVRYFVDEPSEASLLFSRWGENKPWMPQVSDQGFTLIETLIKNNITEFGCLLFRRCVIEEVGLLDESIQGVEDWEYCIRCALANKYFKFISLPNSRILMRHHPESYSKSKRKMLHAAIRVHKKLQTSQKIKLNQQLRKINEQCLFGNIEILGKYEMRKGNIINGMYMILQAAHYKGKTISTIKETLPLLKNRIKLELKKIAVSPDA